MSYNHNSVLYYLNFKYIALGVHFLPKVWNIQVLCIKPTLLFFLFSSIISSLKVPVEFAEDEQKVYDIISSWVNPFEARGILINLASGRECSQDIENQLINAKHIGETALEEFLNQRIYSSIVSFNDPIHKNSLKTFKQGAVVKNICVNGEEVTLRAERSLFGRLLVISPSREGLTSPPTTHLVPFIRALMVNKMVDWWKMTSPSYLTRRCQSNQSNTESIERNRIIAIWLPDAIETQSNITQDLPFDCRM